MKNHDQKKDNEDAVVKPDPETLGPDPEEHMDGPISTLVRKAAESMDENDRKETRKKENEDKNSK